jgi:hypothetical protein
VLPTQLLPTVQLGIIIVIVDSFEILPPVESSECLVPPGIACVHVQN